MLSVPKFSGQLYTVRFMGHTLLIKKGGKDGN